MLILRVLVIKGGLLSPNRNNMIFDMVSLSCRIYDHHLELIQVSRGHEDCIRDIVHIPELDQVGAVVQGTGIKPYTCTYILIMM
jgi:hypothetical protein